MEYRPKEIIQNSHRSTKLFFFKYMEKKLSGMENRV